MELKDLTALEAALYILEAERAKGAFNGKLFKPPPYWKKDEAITFLKGLNEFNGGVEQIAPNQFGLNGTVKYICDYLWNFLHKLEHPVKVNRGGEKEAAPPPAVADPIVWKLARERANQLHHEGISSGSHEGYFDECDHATCLMFQEEVDEEEEPEGPQA